MLTHKYMLATMNAIENYPRTFNNQDTMLSYLPYAHIFEQSMFWFSIFYGMKQGYYQGNPLLVFDDLSALQPTIFVTVPRILNRVYQKIMEAANGAGCCKRRQFFKSVRQK